MTKTYYPAIEVRHEPDGELIAFFGEYFDQEDLIIHLTRILQGTNNFSVRGVENSISHVNFNNHIKIHRDLAKTVKDKKEQDERIHTKALE